MLSNPASLIIVRFRSTLLGGIGRTLVSVGVGLCFLTISDLRRSDMPSLRGFRV